jgi:hypothetical protein
MNDREIEILLRMVGEVSALERGTAVDASDRAVHLGLRDADAAHATEREAGRWSRPGRRWYFALQTAAVAAALLLALLPLQRDASRSLPGKPPVVAASADPSALPGLRSAAEVIYECVQFDANCDGEVTAADLAAFLTALISPEQYESEFPDCDLLCSIDFNCDGAVDDEDIPAVVMNILSGG